MVAEVGREGVGRGRGGGGGGGGGGYIRVRYTILMHPLLASRVHPSTACFPVSVPFSPSSF